MKLNKILFAAAITAAAMFAASCNIVPEPEPGPGPGQDTTVVVPPTDTTVVTGDTLTVAQAISTQDAAHHYVKGIIVGYYNFNLTENKFQAGAPDTADVKSNILIADAAGDLVYDAYLAVQLPTGEIRNALNLKENPNNLGKTVILYGTTEKYCGIAGMKSITYAILDGKAYGSDPNKPSTGNGEGDGTEANPYNATKATEVAGALAQGAKTDTVFITGKVSANPSVDTQYGNATFYITDGTNSFYCFRVKGMGNEKFTSTQQLVEGDSIVIKTVLTNYNGTPETNYGYLTYTSNTYSGGADPEPTDPTLPAGIRDSVDFANNALGLTSEITIKNAQTFTVGTLTITIDGSANASSGAKVSTDMYKMYKGTSFTVTAPSGKNIKAIYNKCASAYPASALTCSDGQFNDNKEIWTGSANSVTMSNTAQVRITKMIVIYE